MWDPSLVCWLVSGLLLYLPLRTCTCKTFTKKKQRNKQHAAQYCSCRVKHEFPPALKSLFNSFQVILEKHICCQQSSVIKLTLNNKTAILHICPNTCLRFLLACKLIYHLSASANEKSCIQSVIHTHSGSRSNMMKDWSKGTCVWACFERCGYCNVYKNTCSSLRWWDIHTQEETQHSSSLVMLVRWTPILLNETPPFKLYSL